MSEAYIQPAPYRTDETVKSDLNRMMVQVDDTYFLLQGRSVFDWEADADRKKDHLGG